MNRIVMSAGAVAMLVLAACGSSNAAGTASSSGSSSASSQNGRGPGRNGASGELVKISGTTLILNAQSGDVTVVYNGSTRIQKTSTGTVADIVAGTCIVATGQKDASGAVTASVVRLSPKVNGSCALGGPGAGGGARPTPRGTPRANPANTGFATGEVTAVSGTSVTVLDATGGSRPVTVPTTVRVSKSSPASASDLGVGDCVLATGPKDSSGTVTARTLSIVPAGPSGCFTGGGGRGFGGGFGGGAVAPAGGAPPAD
jgi:hypothetical protein